MKRITVFEQDRGVASDGIHRMIKCVVTEDGTAPHAARAGNVGGMLSSWGWTDRDPKDVPEEHRDGGSWVELY